MIISDISIKRPVFATILNVLIVVFGLFSLPKLAIERYPNIDFPVVSVWVAWPGADPVSVEKQILEPLERAVNGISGLATLETTAYPNAGLVILKYDLNKESSQVVQDVRDKVFGALGELPLEIQTPIIQKFEIGGDPIINLTLSAKSMNIGELSKVARDVIQPKLQRVDGVARVELIGERKREMHVLMNPAQLSAVGAMPADVVKSIRNQNLDMPVGSIKSKTQEFGIRVQKQITNKSDLANLPLLLSSNKQARLSDVATVKDTIEQENNAAFIDLHPTIMISVFKQSGGNTAAIADSITSSVQNINQKSPNGAQLKIVSDNSKFIKGSIEAVQLDLIFGAILAILVVLLFLRDFRATIISALALPTAVIGTFAFLSYMDFTLNMMTMLGLSLSIGILIDDAIVVIENIYRHLSMGKDAKTAAKDATAEIGLAVFATTLTVCAVFVPVAFMDGIIGRFFYQFGLTVAFAVLLSLFVAFTLTPMLSSKWLKVGSAGHQRNDVLERMLLKVETAYQTLLQWCLRHRWKTLAVGFLSFALSFLLLNFIPVSFFPKEDMSRFNVSITLPENSNLEATKAETLTVARLIKKYPGVTDVVSAVAASGGGQKNTAQLKVNLVEKARRSFSEQDIIARVRTDLSQHYANTKVEFTVGAGGGDNATIQLVLISDNAKELDLFSQDMVEYIKQHTEDTFDVRTSKAKDIKAYNIDINLNLSRDVGLDPLKLANGTRTLYEGEKVGQIEDDSGRYDIRVLVKPNETAGIQEVKNITFNNDKQNRLSLGTVASMENIITPANIKRYDGQRQITVLANYMGPDLNKVVTEIQEFAEENSPKSVKLKLEGEADSMAKSIRSMLLALLMAVLMIYLILCAQYERFLAPLVIMAALPLSLTGAFAALLLAGEMISIYTMIGIILLMGLVTKNGILLVDFTLHEMKNGKAVYESLIAAGTTRLRPILMTTFAAGFGMLPIAIGHGEGGEAKSSMGVAVMGGLFMSTILTLVVVPCFFSVMESFLLRFKKKQV